MQPLVRMIQVTATKRFFSFICLCVIPLSSCNNTAPFNGPTERLPLSSYSEEPFSNFIANKSGDIEVLVLDDSAEVRIGNVDRAILHEDRIYVLDWMQRRLVCYDSYTGAFIRQIGRFGRAGDEYLQITNFDVDANGDIWIIDSQSDHLFKFAPDGHFLFRKNMPFKALDIKVLSKDSLLFALAPINPAKYNKCRLLRCDENLHHSTLFLPYDDDIDKACLLAEYAFSAQAQDSFHLNNLYIDDNVYVLDKNAQITKALLFDFGSNTIPQSVRKNIAAHADDFYYYRCVCPPVSVNGGLVVANMFDGGEYKYFIADRDNNILYVQDDSSPLTKMIYNDQKTVLIYRPGSESDSFMRNRLVEQGMVDKDVIIKIFLR